MVPLMWKIETPFRCLSDWTTFQDGTGPVSRHHPLKCESAAAEQRSVLGLGPLTSNRPAAGELRGVTVDLSRALAEKLGVPVTLIEYRNVGAVVDDARSDAWDIAFL